MRKFLAPAAVAASLVFAPAAFAAAASYTATGSIKSYDAMAHSVTLTSGKTFMLPAKFKADGLKPGAKVQIAWVKKGAEHDATSIKVVK